MKAIFSKQVASFILRIILIIISVYNIVWIPLQFGYFLKFEGYKLGMEVVTVVFYTFDAVILIIDVILMRRVAREIREYKIAIEDTKWDSLISLEKMLRKRYIEVGRGVLAALPIAFVLD